MKELTPDTFASTIAQSTNPVVLDFYSAQCPPCRALAPILDELSAEMEAVSFCKFDVAADDYQIASTYKIKSVPTLIVFRNGEVVARRTGVASKAELKAWVAGLLMSQN